jgi:hypothetical protein
VESFCDDCAAYVVVDLDEAERLVINVVHSDTCPIMRAIERNERD